MDQLCREGNKKSGKDLVLVRAIIYLPNCARPACIGLFAEAMVFSHEHMSVSPAASRLRTRQVA